MKPKNTIFPKAVTVSSDTVENNSNSDALEKKLNDHINDKSVHIDTDTRDSITYLRKDLDNHLSENDIHITNEERELWNAKETPNGAQTKVNKVLTSLNDHKSDSTIHITKSEKDLFKDKYTKAETRNLLKHALTGLVFLEAVNNKSDIDIKYPSPEFNSCVYVRNIKLSYIYNGSKWVEFNGIFTPDVTESNDGYMTKEDKTKLDGIEEGANNYIHPDSVDVRHVTDSQIDYWNKKVDSVLASNKIDGLMSKEDKAKLDSIEEGANNYTHPENHPSTMIVEDETHRFVTDTEKSSWNNKADLEYVNTNIDKTLTAAKTFTDTKIASMFNSSESQLQILRSLSFELKKDDVVKQFFDLYNECVKSEELQDHVLNSKIHMSTSDRLLLNNVSDAINSGLNSDWNETNPSSIKYIENKPKSMPADGGNADTVGGYTAEQLLTNKNFYDYTVGTSDYTNDQVYIVLDNSDDIITIENIINCINKNKGNSVLFKPGNYSTDKEFIIKASNTTFTGIGNASKLVKGSVRIIGNNNVFENITFVNDNTGIVNKTAIYIEGNNNVIKYNNITNYNEGIIIEGSDNVIEHNTIVNIRNNSIKLTSEINSNYGNIIDKNNIKNSNIGISILSSNNSLCKNYITKNNILNSNVGIVLSNTISDKSKTTLNIINENIVIRGRGEKSEYSLNQKTIISEFSTRNIISSNITSGKEIIAPNDILSNNLV